MFTAKGCSLSLTKSQKLEGSQKLNIWQQYYYSNPTVAGITDDEEALYLTVICRCKLLSKTLTI